MENNNDTLNKVTDAVNESVENGVLFAALSYVLILWVLGLVLEPHKNNPFVKKHVNNGIILTILALICAVICWVLNFIPVLGAIISAVVGLAFLGIMILGIYKAYKKQDFILPVIGDSIKIVK